MSGLWNLLSSGQVTAEEGKAFTTIFDLQAHSGTPDMLSSALTYHQLQTENVEEMVKCPILLSLTCCERWDELPCSVTVS